MSFLTPPDQPSIPPTKRAGLVRRMEVGWQDQALCRKFPADNWFPAPESSDLVGDLMQVCRRCPARVSCLAAALAMGEEHGIWGGTTEVDREHGLNALVDGYSVPDVLDQLLTTTTPAAESDRGEAA